MTCKPISRCKFPQNNLLFLLRFNGDVITNMGTGFHRNGNWYITGEVGWVPTHFIEAPSSETLALDVPNLSAFMDIDIEKAKAELRIIDVERKKEFMEHYNLDNTSFRDSFTMALSYLTGWFCAFIFK